MLLVYFWAESNNTKEGQIMHALCILCIRYANRQVSGLNNVYKSTLSMKATISQCQQSVNYAAEKLILKSV